MEYIYDPFDRRVGKKLDANGDGVFERYEWYAYDGDQVALRFVDADGAGAGGSSLTNRYLHGPAVDQVMMDEQLGGDVLYPIADHLGSVRALARKHASLGAEVLNRIQYDAFGNVLSETNPSIDHLFGWTGRDYDPDARLQYNRHRWYDPVIGRWISNDPIGFNAGDANLQRYVGNDAVNLTDPTGHQVPESEINRIRFRPRPLELPVEVVLGLPPVPRTPEEQAGAAMSAAREQETYGRVLTPEERSIRAQMMTAQHEEQRRLQEHLKKYPPGQIYALPPDDHPHTVTCWNWNRIREEQGSFVLLVMSGGVAEVALTATPAGAALGRRSPVFYARKRINDHHLMTDKNKISTAAGGPYTPKFEALAVKRGITLQDGCNRVNLKDHVGPHPEYNKVVYARMKAATKGLRGNAYNDAFDKALVKIATETLTAGTKLNKLATGQ